MKKSLPEPALRSPVPFRPGCNGEFVPAPPSERDRRADELLRAIVDDRARRLGVSRRGFLDSSAGMAAALFVINQVYGCGGAGGDDVGPGGDGGYAVDAARTFDDAGACEALGGDDFIFDVQSHHVDPDGDWRGGSPYEAFLASQPQAACGEPDVVDCFDRNHYVREMFVNSDTTVAVLSAVPAVEADNPLVAAEQAATRDVVNQLAGSQRLLIHGMVLPDLGQAQLDGMQRLVEELDIAAWKVYTPYGGWRFTDDVGLAFIERARDLGVKVICAHKGLPLPGFDPAFASPEDVGVVAAMYPDMTFVVYHSGYETAVVEGPYDAAGAQGVDRLVKTVIDNGIFAPGGPRNVYAELGSTWRLLMTNATQASHVLGKLLAHLGEDHVLWGTDSIWYGSPQDQIAAFRAFEPSPTLLEMYEYPALTAAVKAKIFGLNAAGVYGVDPTATRCAIDGDALDRRRRAARAGEGPRPPRLPPAGPRTRRELFAFLRGRGGHPG